ncbi:MAG: rhomboid family intramembrane serine protease [Flavobacteriaceae bacterium]|jgi:membrane associated rhomboid family serine protease|nr:rhomboid family intramembrane serine protease [Flavobacteriaceae bacterium]
MNLLIIIIAITAIISYYGFQNFSFFEKYKFNVGAVRHRKEYIRLLSSGFLHADMMHLIFNMLTLYFFGDDVILNFGKAAFIIIYIGSILVGNLFTLFYYKHQSWYSAIGASGGVSGILFASVVINPFTSINFIPGFIFGAIYFGYSVYQMINPQQNDNIGHAAHLGGAAFGLVYAVATVPEMAISNALYLGIMAIPLLYLAYEIFVKKKK